MDANAAGRIARLPAWLRLLLVVPVIVAAVAGVVVRLDRLEERRPQLACVLDDPIRTEYLSTEGVWSTTSSPGSIAAVVSTARADGAEAPAGGAGIRGIHPPDGWELADATPAQRAALEPYVVGDHLLVDARSGTCHDSVTGAPDLTVGGDR